jgi:16S rRNA (cytidine1402-2'-O)-methyltransferase
MSCTTQHKVNHMSQGVLYIVSTPIGNLEDITLRALRIFKEVDLIAAEDTRKTGILLRHYNIKKKMTSYFEHNEQYKVSGLISQLKSGKKIALVSSAGTPSISDPGFRLVRAALNESIPVVPVPGASSVITALSVSSLPVHRFAFEGFLPPKTGKRKNFLLKIADDDRTLIFFESPHRILATLKDMIEIFGDRRAMLARELTKLHEETMLEPLTTLYEQLEDRKIKGEITLVVEGKI